MLKVLADVAAVPRCSRVVLAGLVRPGPQLQPLARLARWQVLEQVRVLVQVWLVGVGSLVLAMLVAKCLELARWRRRLGVAKWLVATWAPAKSQQAAAALLLAVPELQEVRDLAAEVHPGLAGPVVLEPLVWS